MKKIELFGNKLNRQQLMEISGGNEIGGSGADCVVKSCKSNSDCANVTNCNCYRNYNPGTGKPDTWGYCQKRS